MTLHRVWPDPESDRDRRLYQMIREHGWMIRYVFDEKGRHPSFHYSAGIYETLGKPEIVLFGLYKEVGQWVINEYGRRLKVGESFEPGDRYSDFLEGYDVVFQQVDCRRARRITTWTDWFYERKGFPLVQLVWPDKDAGKFPWEPDCDLNAIRMQPLLADEYRFKPRWLRIGVAKLRAQLMGAGG